MTCLSSVCGRVDPTRVRQGARCAWARTKRIPALPTIQNRSLQTVVDELYSHEERIESSEVASNASQHSSVLPQRSRRSGLSRPPEQASPSASTQIRSSRHGFEAPPTRTTKNAYKKSNAYDYNVNTGKQVADKGSKTRRNGQQAKLAVGATKRLIRKPAPHAAIPSIGGFALPGVNQTHFVQSQDWRVFNNTNGTAGGKLSDVQPEFHNFVYWKQSVQLLSLGMGIRWLESDIKSTLGVADQLINHSDVASLRQEWQKLDPEQRKEIWSPCMLYAMERARDRGIVFLGATLDSKLPGYAIHDALGVIAASYPIHEIKDEHERIFKADQLLETLTKVIDNLPHCRPFFRQPTISRLAKLLPPDQTKTFYEVLERNRVLLKAETLLHFARKLSISSAHKSAGFSILKLAVAQGVPLDSPVFSSVLTSLLHRSRADDVQSGSEAAAEKRDDFDYNEALQHFVEEGFTPNIITFTSFLDSLCRNSQLDEAIRLALLFAETGAELDVKSWTTLSRAAKNSRDVNQFIKTLNFGKMAGATNIDLLNSALHGALVFAASKGKDENIAVSDAPKIFPSMLRIYAKKFDLRPLQSWIPDSLPLGLRLEPIPSQNSLDAEMDGQLPNDLPIIRAVEGFFSEGDGARLRPSPTTIATMLRAYIHDMRGPYELMSYYTFFKSALESPTGLITAEELIASQGSLIHDTIISSMIKTPSLARPALQIFGDMLKDHLRTKKVKDGQGKPSTTGGDVVVVPAHPSPSLYTFNIIIHGLLSAFEKDLAEQLLQVMGEQAIEPNLVTWNTLIQGYASMQDVSSTVASLQQLESAGHKPDHFTFKAFGMLRNQEKALQMMEGIIDENRKKVEEGDFAHYFAK